MTEGRSESLIERDRFNTHMHAYKHFCTQGDKIWVLQNASDEGWVHAELDSQVYLCLV
jgi:hypothetical protein